LFSRAILQIKEAGLVSLNEQRRILALEVSLGLALSTDLAQADLTIADARIEILSSEVDIAEAEQQFAEFLGLETIPFLAETVDIRRGAVLPSPEMIRGLAIEKNPELAVARYSIAQRQEQLKIASRSWIPTVKLTGSFGLSGQQYPLTRYNWSIGISLDFSSPFFSNTAKATFGSEPPYDKTAQLQNSLTPLSDLASALDIRSARMALDLEKSKYETSLERAERLAINALEKCSLIEKKRSLSVQALELAAEKLKLDELRFNLGQLIRIDMMDAHIEYTQQEAAAVEAAIALMEADRELERSLDLTPGGLMRLAVGD
jgi:outer membrane protein TolC